MAHIDAAIDELRRRWAAGDRARVECFALTDPDALLDLIYAEVLLREAAGERPRFEEYVARFPSLAEPLRVQFEVHEAIEGDAATPREVRLIRRDGGEALALTLDAAGVVLGRSSGCDVVLREPGVSRRHCKLMAGDELFVEDLDSRHGTSVNGEPVHGRQADQQHLLPLRDGV